METSRDAVNLARSGHLKTVELVRESGQLYGEVLATAVSPPVLRKMSALSSVMNVLIIGSSLRKASC